MQGYSGMQYFQHLHHSFKCIQYRAILECIYCLYHTNHFLLFLDYIVHLIWPMYCICCLGGSYGIPYDYELKNVLPQIMEIEIIDEMTWYLINFTTVDGTSLTDFMIREEFIGMYDLIAPLGPQQVEAFMASDKNTRTLRDLLPPKKCTKLYCLYLLSSSLYRQTWDSLERGRSFWIQHQKHTCAALSERGDWWTDMAPCWIFHSRWKAPAFFGHIW